MGLYQQSLDIHEHLGDLQGKSATLHEMANVYMGREEWGDAEQCLRQALAISRQLGDLSGLAYNTVKLGQVAQARGDQAGALAGYREGLAIFDRLGMPGPSAQVKALIAALGSGAPPPDSLRQAIAAAGQADQRGDAAAAVAAQEQAVVLARGRGEGRDDLVTLSVLLYNLAGYCSKAGQPAKAVRALEEVVALDERTGHEDLASDRQALEAARRAAAPSPGREATASSGQRSPTPSPGERQDAEALLAEMTPEQRAQAEAAVREFARRLAEMPPEQQAALADQAQRSRIQTAADQVRDAAVAAARGELSRDELISQLEDNAARAAEGEQPGSPWDELAAYMRAVIALLRGETPPPVPVAYAGHLAAVLAAVNDHP